MSIDVILHEPEQPGNTGAIGRPCLCAGAGLHLIRPLGFLTDEKSVRRAGLDYWPRLNVHEYDNFDAFCAAHPEIDPEVVRPQRRYMEEFLDRHRTPKAQKNLKKP